MSLSAHGMLQVVAAKRDHDTHCPWKKPALEVHIHPGGLEAFGWEDGDDIAGLKVVADDKVPRKRLHVFCDGDLKEGAGKKVGDHAEDEIVHAVSTERESDRELVTVGPREGAT